MDNRLREYLERLWRQKAWIGVPLVLGGCAAFFGSGFLPKRYEASTVILVEAQKVPAAYIQTTVTSSLHERLRSLEQQIKSRDNLQEVIAEIKPYGELDEEHTLEWAVRKIRRGLTVEGLPGAFRLRFTGADPERVAKLVNRLADLFIAENLRMRENQAMGTTEFLEGEMLALRRELEEKEQVIADFRLRNDGQLPEQTVVVASAIGQLEAKLEINREQLEDLELRRLLLDRKSPAQELETTTQSHLKTLRSNLVMLRAEYTDRHPDVLRLEAEISRLEEVLASEEPAVPIVAEPTATDPLLVAAERDRQRLIVERDRLVESLASLQRRFELIPRVGQQLLMLTRDYDNLRGSYEGLLAKRTEAGLAENLERRQQSEQFTIVDRAIPPSRPVFPNRKLVTAAGLVLGLIVGVGLVLLREELVTTFPDARALRQAFPNVLVAAEIPWIEVPAEASTDLGEIQEASS